MTRQAPHRFDAHPRIRVVMVPVCCPHCDKIQRNMVREHGTTYRRCRHCNTAFAIVDRDGAFIGEVIT